MSAPNQLSFLPDDYLARKAQRRTNAICAILFLIVTVAIGAAFTYTDRGLKEARQGAASVAQQYAQAARPIEQFQKLQEKQRTMAHQAELTSSLIEKVPRSFLLAELTNSLPSGVSLIDMVLDSKRRTAAAPPAPKSAFEAKANSGAAAAAAAAATAQVQAVTYDVGIKVTGMAANDVQVAQFISKLNVSRLLNDVNLVVSDEFKQGDEKLRRFQIEMKLNPAAEVDPLSNRQTKTAAVDLTGK
ncbi:MAG: PilN domain-containing protein [Tepidisphaeraceae bacterium]